MPSQFFVAVPVDVEENEDSGLSTPLGASTNSTRGRKGFEKSGWEGDDTKVKALLAEKLGVEPTALSLHTLEVFDSSQLRNTASPMETGSGGGVATKRVVAFLSTDEAQTMVEESTDSSLSYPSRADTPGMSNSGMSSSNNLPPSQPTSALGASGQRQLANPNHQNGTLEEENALLKAEVEDLRAKVEEITAFKDDVLRTIKQMKKEVSVITEDVLLGQYDADDD